MEIQPKQHTNKGPAAMSTGDVVEIHPGETIYTPPGEWHWHGATADDFICHLAMWEGTGEGSGPETEWGDHVTEGEYIR